MPNGHASNGIMCETPDFNLVYLANDELKQFEHQVSGHGSREKGLLKHKNGYILKPLQPPPMGTREVSFYQQIHGEQKHREDCYARLQQFVPKYHGMACLTRNVTSNENNTSLRYLLLDDIIEGFKRPCVVDIKIGSQTWSPDASEAKIKQEMSKYKGTKLPLGLCLTGMQFYDVHKCENCKLSKDFCKSLNPSTLKTMLERFFNKAASDSHCTLANHAVKKIRELEKVFDVQKIFKLYGSSVLIAYDADFFSTEFKSKAYTDENIDVSLDEGKNVPLRVFIIDFAHFHLSEDDSVDENYLFGLRNLINILCNIAELAPATPLSQ